MSANERADAEATATPASVPAIKPEPSADEPVATQSGKSSSYAKVVAVVKDDKTASSQTTNAKQQITATASVPSKAPTPNRNTATAVAVVNDSNQNEKKSPESNENRANDAEDEDDSTFTPVVSHNRKDRNVRRNNNNNNSHKEGRRERGTDGASSRQGTRRPPRTDNERAERKEGRRPRGNRGDKDKNANTDQPANVAEGIPNTVVAVKPTSGSSNGDESADDPANAGENATKFVEAPLPKVNAWKVSDFNFLFFYHINLLVLRNCSV